MSRIFKIKLALIFMVILQNLREIVAKISISVHQVRQKASVFAHASPSLCDAHKIDKSGTGKNDLFSNKQPRAGSAKMNPSEVSARLNAMVNFP